MRGRNFLVNPERCQGTSQARSRVFRAVGIPFAKALRREGIGMFCNLKGGQSDGSIRNRVRETGSGLVI